MILDGATPKISAQSIEINKRKYGRSNMPELHPCSGARDPCLVVPISVCPSNEALHTPGSSQASILVLVSSPKMSSVALGRHVSLWISTPGQGISVSRDWELPRPLVGNLTCSYQDQQRAVHLGSHPPPPAELGKIFGLDQKPDLSTLAQCRGTIKPWTFADVRHRLHVAKSGHI